MLLVVFNVPIILGFTIGSFYALFVCKKLTSFRGACRVLNKDFYDGVVDTAPLVGFLLMIPMFNKAAELCVPYFNALLGNIIPNNTLVISIVFAILAPLGLFRGPFTLFGCGAATLGILKGIGFSTPYLYYNECINLYDTELDCMGSKLLKSIHKRTSEDDTAICMACMYHHAGNHICYVRLRRA